MQTAEWVDRWAKVAVRVVQAFCYVASVFQTSMAKVLTKAAIAALPGDAEVLARWAEKRAGKATSWTDLAGTIETLADCASLFFVKAPIFGMEFAHLNSIFTESEYRVKWLYNDRSIGPARPRNAP